MIDYDMNFLIISIQKLCKSIDKKKEYVVYILSLSLDGHAAQLFITASKNYGFHTENNSNV